MAIKHSVKKRKTHKKSKTGDKPLENIYILFDLDGTLVNVDLENKPYEKSKSYGPHNLKINRFKKSTGEDTALLMYLRPHLETFLSSLPSFIKIGIWTSSFYTYAKGIIDVLFGPDAKNKLTLFFAGNESVTNGVKHRYAYDVYTDTNYDSRNVNKKVVKDLNILFNHPEYGKILNPKNTLLIDDLKLQKDENPAETRDNVLLISPWNSNHYCDTDLHELRNWLKTLGTCHDIRQVKKPNFRSGKGKPYLKYDIEDESQNTANFFNKYCSTKTKKKSLNKLN